MRARHSVASTHPPPQPSEYLPWLSGMTHRVILARDVATDARASRKVEEDVTRLRASAAAGSARRRDERARHSDGAERHEREPAATGVGRGDWDFALRGSAGGAVRG